MKVHGEKIVKGVNMFKNSKAIILLGPPGSGKTSLARQLAMREDLFLIKAGKLLKDEVKKRTWWGDQLRLYMDNHLFPPARLVKEVVAQSVEWASSDRIIFEGFPSSMDEINSFFEIEIREEISLSVIIVLEISLEMSLERLVNRRVCRSCGEIYNLAYYSSQRRKICDRCGKLLYQLKDDQPDKIYERMDYFKKYSKPVIEHFKNHYSKKTFMFDAQKSLPELTEPILSLIRKSTSGNNEKICNKNSRH